MLDIASLLPFTLYTVVVHAETVEVGLPSVAVDVRTDESGELCSRAFFITYCTVHSRIHKYTFSRIPKFTFSRIFHHYCAVHTIQVYVQYSKSEV